MEINLDKKYRITADSRQYILQKKVKERWVGESYYVKLEVLLQDYIDMQTRCSDVKTIQELIDYQKRLVTALNKAVQPLKIEVKTKE